jgi:hypothetical protein
MASAVLIKCLKSWFKRGLKDEVYIQSLVPSVLTQTEADEIIGGV